MLIKIGMAIAALASLVTLLIFVRILYNKFRYRKAMNGDYGDEVKWSFELLEEDEKFKIAIAALPKEQLTEVGIIAESKEELRDLTVERFENLAGEPLPEEFA